MSRYRTITANPQRNILRKGPNGRNLCRFCGIEVTPPRRTFCSGDRTHYGRRKLNGIWTKIVTRQGFGCVHEWLIRSSPQYARQTVFDRDHGICVSCGTQHNRNGDWHADHITPVWAGGGEAPLSNYQTLCKICHLEKTKKEAHVRKQQRLLIKETNVQ